MQSTHYRTIKRGHHLRFYYDLKIREIATITKASVSNVKSRLQQGIKKLERYLADFRGGDNV